jgi:anthranilate phosphoribosyltransferase
VALNAAHILLLSGLTTSMAEGVSVAEDILRDGVALARIPIASTP